MNWSNSYSILLASSLLCRCGNKLLSKYFYKCTFNISFKLSHCWQQMIDRVRLKRNCGVASVGEETQKIGFFLHYRAIKSIYHHRKVMKLTFEQACSPLSVWVEAKNYWFAPPKSKCSKHQPFNVNFYNGFFLNLSTAVTHNSVLSKTKFSLSATLLNQTWFSAAKWEHTCNVFIHWYTSIIK